jgi:hypothetical protein
MAAAGNVYRHDYEDVTANQVWKTLRDHLAPLRLVIEKELVDPGLPAADPDRGGRSG